MEEIIKIENFKCRTCSECKKGMNEGYCIGDGEEYYCSDECLHKHYTPIEWEEIYKNDGGYWTEWDIEEEYNEYLEEFKELSGDYEITSTIIIVVLGIIGSVLIWILI